VNGLESAPILPGAALGILGGGQLGAMFGLAARRMGYRVECLSEADDNPAARQSDRLHLVSFNDPAAVARAATGLDAITLEFENIPVAAVEALSSVAAMRPGPSVLFVTQDRIREKAFLQRHRFPCTPHRAVHSLAELRAAADEIGLPAVLKTASFGYDGKGQRRLESAADLVDAWNSVIGDGGRPEAVLESWIDFDCEMSVVAARGPCGATAAFPPFRNRHARHVLDVSSSPAGLSSGLVAEATALTVRILEVLEVVGVACVEFFVTRDGRLLVNEIAPRTHNSGHLTIEACATSQFEQQVRAVCGLPLGSVHQHAPAAMANLLGDGWSGGPPDWAAALDVPGVTLHLYGKAIARPGRKMGHLTALAATVEDAVGLVTEARRRAFRGAGES
jgi:5-(carboxyamino)imidazole ribonucleotide synthase